MTVSFIEIMVQFLPRLLHVSVKVKSKTPQNKCEQNTCKSRRCDSNVAIWRHLFLRETLPLYKGVSNLCLQLVEA